jgi:hypothetical protein
MGKKNNETLVLVREALAQLKRGDIVDAQTTLERCAYPKWESVGQSEADYWSRKPVDEIVAAIANDNKEAAADASGGEGECAVYC